jgi:hypothetical protein
MNIIKSIFNAAAGLKPVPSSSFAIEATRRALNTENNPDMRQGSKDEMKHKEARKPLKRMELPYGYRNNAEKPNIPPGMFKIIADAAQAKIGTGLFTDNEIAELTRINADWWKLHDFLVEHSNDAARSLYYGQHNEIGSDLAAKDFDQAREKEFRSKEEIALQFITKRKAAKLEQKNVLNQAVPIYVKGFERFAKVAGLMADDLEKIEEAEAAKLGWPYKPSLKLVCLGQLTWRANEFLPGASIPPSSLLRRFGITIENTQQPK